MNKIKLLVDGGCDLPKETLEKYALVEEVSYAL